LRPAAVRNVLHKMIDDRDEALALRNILVLEELRP
jgi:hypothetical protein